MADERLVYGSSDQMTVLLHNEINPCDPSAALESLLIPNSSPSFHGEFGTENSSFFEPVEKDATNDDDFDGFWRQPGKKRRLSVDQVQFLEKNFEVENKLEPERKIQLAKELGLQPRQVAIWFQNRRARYKTKQLEKDFSSLRNIHDKLKSDYDSLIKEKENLQVEVNTLKEKLAIREKLKQNSSSNTEGSEKVSSSTPMAVCKQEEASSTKSVVFDSDSPHNLENHSSMAEPGDSNSNGFEPDQSDFSQDEEDNLSRNLLPACFPKLEGCYYDEHQIIEDPPLGFWLF